MKNKLSTVTLIAASLLSEGCSPCGEWYKLHAEKWGSNGLFQQPNERFEGFNKWEQNPVIYLGHVADESGMSRDELLEMTKEVVRVWNEIAAAVGSDIPQLELSPSDELDTDQNFDLNPEEIPEGAIVLSIPDSEDSTLDEEHHDGRAMPVLTCEDTSIRSAYAFVSGPKCLESEIVCKFDVSHEIGHALGLAHAYGSGYYLMTDSDEIAVNQYSFYPSMEAEGRALYCMYIDPEGCLFEGTDEFQIE